jgi:hypothetical protein
MQRLSQQPRLRSAGSSHLQLQIHPAIPAQFNLCNEKYLPNDHLAVRIIALVNDCSNFGERLSCTSGPQVRFLNLGLEVAVSTFKFCKAGETKANPLPSASVFYCAQLLPSGLVGE